MSKLSITITLVAALAGFAASPPARRSSLLAQQPSAAFAGASIVRLRSGLTRVDVIGDGSPGAILTAVKENQNAHGYHAVAIVVQPRAQLEAQPRDSDWKIVSVEGGSRGTGDELGTEEGADCTLRDVRFLRRGRGRPITLVVGQRALNASYADADSVRFTVYELRHNTSGVVGRPTYYFEPTETIAAHHLYCDINVAFDRELGLGRAGVAPSEASEVERSVTHSRPPRPL